MINKVCIGVACSQAQHHTWWGTLASHMVMWDRDENIEVELITVGSALPDFGKNTLAHVMMGRNAGITSENRNAVVEVFGHYGSEWLFMLDDDTIPPADSLPRLLARQRPFVAGAYFHGNAPHVPIAYQRTPSGLYRFVRDFERGALVECDAVGMGCTLIAHEVFASIKEEFRRFQRTDGSEVLVHEDDIHERSLPRGYRGQVGLWGNSLVTPLKTLEAADRRAFPFFMMEHGRTEDLFFCELAARVGYKPVLDTAVECRHVKPLEVTGEHFHALRNELLIRGEGLEEMEYAGA